MFDLCVSLMNVVFIYVWSMCLFNECGINLFDLCGYLMWYSITFGLCSYLMQRMP